MKDCRCDIYDPKDENENKIYRYALGKSGKKMIICIALNPSSATDKEPDRTFNKICSILKNQDENYDGFVLLNLCPMRGAKPKEVQYDEELANKNAKIVKKYLDKYPQAPIWCAWGGNICQKKFKYYFYKISHLIENRKCACTSETTKGHPRHPLYVASDTQLKEFCIKNYIQQNIIDF